MNIVKYMRVTRPVSFLNLALEMMPITASPSVDACVDGRRNPAKAARFRLTFRILTSSADAVQLDEP